MNDEPQECEMLMKAIAIYRSIGKKLDDLEAKHIKAQAELNAQEYNNGHLVEGLQTCHIIMGIIDGELTDHPAVIKANMQREVEEAIDKVMKVYQAIGRLDEVS